MRSAEELTIAVAQTVPVAGDVEANLAQHLQLMRAAANAGAQVVVFPELSLTGYELSLADRLAFVEEDARLAPLRDAASSSRTLLIVGAPLRLDGQLHIAAFALSPEGNVTTYTKGWLGAFPSDVGPDGVVPPAEDTVFVPGNRQPLVHFEGQCAAIGICGESLFEQHSADAAQRGATAYLTGHFGIPLDVGFRAKLLRAYARRHSMVVAFANYGGPTGGLRAGGKSAIWSEGGERLAELPPEGAGIAIAKRGAGGWVGVTR